MNPNTSIERLYMMEVARVGEPMNRPVVAYLIQTSDGQNILVDTGLATDAPIPPGFPPVGWGKTVVEQLASIGIKPESVDVLICTHFDMDHASYNGAFTNARLVVQRRHYDNALQNPRYAFTRPQWDQPAERFQFVDGDCQLLPGVELIATDGHATGHQSLLVRLPQTGAVLLTIDSVMTQGRFNVEVEKSPQDEDLDALRASTQKLLDVVEREQVALTIFGHDGAQWAALNKLPEFYS